jgi:hypothetical protein
VAGSIDLFILGSSPPPYGGYACWLSFGAVAEMRFTIVGQEGDHQPLQLRIKHFEVESNLASLNEVKSN